MKMRCPPSPTAGLYNDNLQGSVPLVILNQYVLAAALKQDSVR